MIYAKLSVRKECHWTRVRKALLRTACYRFVGCVPTGRASFATAISTRCWKWSSVRCVGECDCLGTYNAIQPCARPSNSNSTPRRRDGILLLCTFFRKLWKVLFFLEEHMYCLLHRELLSICSFRRVGSEFRLCLLRLISTDAFLATDVNARKF